MSEIKRFDDLVGHTCIRVENRGGEELLFQLDDGRKFKLHHNRDCCETVYIEDIAGDLQDIVGAPLLTAEESSNNLMGERKSFTWTFYRMSTIKGSVTIRWQGESNGYYSESVDFEECDGTSTPDSDY